MGILSGSKEELQMVDGADTWLDKLSNNGQEVNLAISIEEPLTNNFYQVFVVYCCSLFVYEFSVIVCVLFTLKGCK